MYGGLADPAKLKILAGNLLEIMICFKLTFPLHLFKNFKTTHNKNNQFCLLLFKPCTLDEKISGLLTNLVPSFLAVTLRDHAACSLPRKWLPLTTCRTGFPLSWPLGV